MTKSKAKVDRKARNRLIAATERFLAEKTTAFEFDDEIFEIQGKTEDATVQALVLELWLFYDDCTDHRVALNRQAWNSIQRALLLLQSDYHLRVERKLIWLPTQLAAAVALAVFAVGVWRAGIEPALLLLFAFHGFFAVTIWIRKGELLSRNRGAYAPILQPFGSFAELAEVRRKVPKYQKQRFPREIGQRQIRGLITETLMWAPLVIGCVILAPLVLFFQMFPATLRTTRVVSC